jgi:hypothetical protein
MVHIASDVLQRANFSLELTLGHCPGQAAQIASVTLVES